MTNFTVRDHFHLAGNFLRTFNARNLRANFFCACHITRPSSVCVGVAAPPLSYTFWLLNFSTSSLKRASNSAFQSPVALMLRSEEHTSELQSRGHLVCRLLLEKK